MLSLVRSMMLLNRNIVEMFADQEPRHISVRSTVLLLFVCALKFEGLEDQQGPQNLALVSVSKLVLQSSEMLTSP